MRRIVLSALTMAALVVATPGCDENGDAGFSIDATGMVGGLVWLDRNGNGVLDGNDGPVGDITVELVPHSGGAAAYSATSDGNGEFLIRDVLPGDYTTAVDSASVGDTLRIQLADSSTVTVAANGTAVVLVGLAFPAVPVDSARIAPAETRLMVEGLILTRWNVFADQTLHVRDTTGAVRAVRVQPTGVLPGDSVRLLGTTSLQTGQPVLKDVTVFLLQTGLESPEPDTVTTAMAASAAGGTLDAALIHLDSAVIQDTTRNANGEFIMTVSDGSGAVDVVLDRDVSFGLAFEDEILGTILEVTGVLVPVTAGGDWVVKPRGSDDLVVGELSYPTVTVAEARAASGSTRLIVEGVALNGWATFADSTVHVRDATGAIRSVRVSPANVLAGDSVRAVGTPGTVLGQPVLTQVAMRRLAAAVSAPEPRPTDTGSAATGGGGTLDAQLVRILGATVQDTTRNASGELVLRLDDGSGSLDMVIDRHISFAVSFGAAMIGSVIDATGLLVPTTTVGRWILKPRAGEDVEVR